MAQFRKALAGLCNVSDKAWTVMGLYALRVCLSDRCHGNGIPDGFLSDEDIFFSFKTADKKGKMARHHMGGPSISKFVLN